MCAPAPCHLREDATWPKLHRAAKVRQLWQQGGWMAGKGEAIDGGLGWRGRGRGGGLRGGPYYRITKEM